MSEFTQFEDIHARKAFPSFDEPLYKVPWQLTIETPEGNRAYANTPVSRESASGRDDWTRFEFARSKPLPSYLVAFAVGSRRWGWFWRRRARQRRSSPLGVGCATPRALCPSQVVVLCSV